MWSPHTLRNVNKLKRLQRRGTKFILGKRNLTNEERIERPNLVSLEKRRCLFDVTFLYRALNGYLNVDVSPFLKFYSQDDPYRFRHVVDYSLKTNFGRKTNFKQNYFNRIVEMWNSIPVDIRLSRSLAALKSGMKKFLMLLLFYIFL